MYLKKRFRQRGTKRGEYKERQNTKTKVIEKGKEGINPS